MMKYDYGDMWNAYNEADLFCITTSASLNRQKHLIMGKGIAAEAKKRFPDLPQRWGPCAKFNPTYGLIALPDTKLAAFQTKLTWDANAQPQLIAQSVAALVEWCKAHPNAAVQLPYPGIGYGGLSEREVFPLLAPLKPYNVTVWRRRQSKMLICGSRDANDAMRQYARNCVAAALERGYWIIAGDAVGVDCAVAEAVRDLFHHEDEMVTAMDIYGWGSQPRHRVMCDRFDYYNMQNQTVTERIITRGSRDLHIYDKRTTITNYRERDAYMVRRADSVMCITSLKGTPGTLNVYRMAQQTGKECWLMRF